MGSTMKSKGNAKIGFVKRLIASRQRFTEPVDAD
jgi:hypothetical protein